MSIPLKHIAPVVGLTLALSPAAFAQATDQPRSPGSPPSTQQPSSPGSQQPSSPPSSQTPGQQQRSGSQADTVRGELVSVDTAGKMLTIRMANGMEQKVEYNDDTKVTGERGGIAGLGKMSGRQVIVHFDTKAAANRVAREIEVQAAGTSPSTTPSTRPGGTGGAGDRPGGTGGTGGAGDRPGGTGGTGGAGDRPGGAGSPGTDKPGGDR